MSNQRGLVHRLERTLETTVGDAFARIFGGAIVPEEVEMMLRREAADEIRSLEGNRLLAPNDYVITLGVHDYEKVVADPDITANAFAANLAEYIGERGWQTYGDVVIRFEPTTNLHTGQFRTRGGVNPDAAPDQNVIDIAPPQAARQAPRQPNPHAFHAEPGAAPMTDNPSNRGDQGQGWPGDEYSDDPYGRPEDDPRAGQEPRSPYPPEPSGYGPQQDQGGYQPPRRPEPGGYPDRGPSGYPDQGPGGYPPRYEQRPPYEPRPPAGYGGGHDAGYRPPAPGGYRPPAGGPPGYDDYGRGPARPSDAGYGPPEQRPYYPERGGYDQGYQSGAPYGPAGYGRYPDAPGGYGEPPGGRYPDAPPPASGYGRPPSGYPERGGYDYGQPSAPSGYDYGPAQPSGYDYGQGYAQPPGGYGEPAGDYGEPAGGYEEPGYGAGYGDFPPSAASGVTLQLDDGSGRTYQLRDGANVVGRGQDAHFRLPDTGVSRRHLEIRWDGQVALVSDLNSTNGTTVNNAPVQEWQLADGDIVRLGHSEIIVRFY